MSKVIKAIESHQLNNCRIVEPMPTYVSVNSEITKQDYTREYAYELSVKFSVKRFSRSTQIIDETTYIDAKRAIIEDIFGEFRPLLMQALHSTYERDFVATRDAIYKLEDKMFREGLTN